MAGWKLYLLTIGISFLFIVILMITLKHTYRKEYGWWLQVKVTYKELIGIILFSFVPFINVIALFAATISLLGLIVFDQNYRFGSNKDKNDKLNEFLNKTLW